MGTLNIRINDKLEKDLARLAKKQQTTKSEVVRELLRKHMALAELRALRRKLIPYAEAAGYYTDEDVFRDIS
jgi:predicted transcriptional regulator